MSKPLSYRWIGGLLLCLWVFSAAEAVTRNGFLLDGATVPMDDILRGGPPRDSIPAIDQPKYIASSAADFLTDADRILGIEIAGEARAFPIKILDWHEIVNDRIADQAVMISYCPLCGTGMAFSAQVGERELQFGVSGLLYQSDVLFYDRETESLWSQIMGQAVSGELRGQSLTGLPVFHTSWADWRERYPHTLVLSTETGFSRDYTRSPYAGYTETRRLYFRVNHKAPATYHPKEQVMGLTIGETFKAYPFSELAKHGQTAFEDTVAGKKITVHWDDTARSAYVTDATGQTLVTTVSFWFAWFTFHPETAVYKAS
ncbi:MAG TPA: hypothetical protein DD979_00280 [Gammaproteobacteria bacterium]|nr:hypothetical protein [Gammaproteobacteria bacterium]